MKKSDLDNGMVVEVRKGESYIVIKDGKDRILSIDGILELERYNEDLRLIHRVSNEYDIVKVYKTCQTTISIMLSPNRYTGYHTLLWERSKRSDIEFELKKLENEEIELTNKIKKLRNELSVL